MQVINRTPVYEEDADISMFMSAHSPKTCDKAHVHERSQTTFLGNEGKTTFMRER